MRGRLLVHNTNCELVSISYCVEHSPSPSGVLLVRFLPTRAENEHNKHTDKSKFEEGEDIVIYLSI